MRPLVHRHEQRGAAALIVTALLFFAMLLMVAAANRSMLVEARSSANQYRSTQAFEAAEAGLEWALAKLNDGARIGDDCLPSGTAGALSFRDRHLRYDDAAGALVPTTWDDGGTPKSLQAACVRGDAGWSCSCPTSGVPSLPPVAGDATAPAFVVELSAGAKPGLVVAAATGCTTSAARTTPCDGAVDVSHEGSSRIEVAFGLVSALRTPPSAALTARGNVDAGAAALGLRNGDTDSGGVMVDAGGHVAGTALRLSSVAGSSIGGRIVSGDTALSGLDGDRFFARWFGMSKATWTAQPAVTRLDCRDDCGAAVVAAVARGSRLVSVNGDLSIDGPASLGTSEQPVVLFVAGALSLRGAVDVHGLVFAGSIRWNDAGTGGSIDGAAVSEGDYAGDAASDFIHDTRTLARLRGSNGSFARVDGSWKDF